MLASLSLGAIGALCLVLFGVFYWLGIFATARAILAFVGGILIGSAGFLGGALTAVGTWLSNIAASVTGWAFGFPVLAAVTVIFGVVFVHDLMPKHTAGKRTGWAGLILAGLIVAGATGIPALNSVGSTIQSAVTNAKSIVG
jgi:hypothetical protein